MGASETPGSATGRRDRRRRWGNTSTSPRRGTHPAAQCGTHTFQVRHLSSTGNHRGRTKVRRRSRRGAPVKLLLRVDLEAFLRGFPVEGETCDLVGYGPVSMSAVHEILADGDPFVVAILTKGKQLAGVAHLGRRPNAYQRSCLEWLYPTCAVQGCAAAARLEMDHRDDWARTHVTVLDLLDALCPHHHRLKTRQGWSLVDGFGKRAFVAADDPRHPRHRGPTGTCPDSPRRTDTRPAAAAACPADGLGDQATLAVPCFSGDGDPGAPPPAGAVQGGGDGRDLA